MVAGLSVTIGRQLNESKRLMPLPSRPISRFKHIAANSSGKVVAKWHGSSDENGEAHPLMRRPLLRDDALADEQLSQRVGLKEG